MLILSCILFWLLLLYTPTKTKEILFVIIFSIENQRIILFFVLKFLWVLLSSPAFYAIIQVSGGPAILSHHCGF